MTMPSLIQKNQDKELISRTKKVYSEISNALLLAQNDLGVVGDNSFLFNVTDDSSAVAQKMLKYFKGATYCKNASQNDCEKYYYDVKYATLYLDSNGAGEVMTLAAYPKLILPNGEYLAIVNNQRENCSATVTTYKTNEYGQAVLDEDGNTIPVTYNTNVCGQIYFDVNGSKQPNQFGRDVYALFIDKQSLKPSTNAYHGLKSLTNILSGKEKLEYANYSKGQTFEF